MSPERINALDDEEKTKKKSSKSSFLRGYMFRRCFPKVSKIFKSQRSPIPYGIRRLLKIVFSLLLLVALLYKCAELLRHEKNQKIIKYTYAYAYNYYSGREVLTKKDLLNVDISSLLENKDFSSSPITEEVRNQEYQKKEYIGYVSNLDLSNFSERDLLTREALTNQELENQLSHSYDTIVSCENISYYNEMEYSSNIKTLNDDVISLRREILKQKNRLSLEIIDDQHDGVSESDIVRKQWFRFGGSAVWLESENCYVVYTRLIYSRRENKGDPHISLVRAQAFDKDWNEIIGKQIPYLDVIKPESMEQEMEKVEQELNVQKCSSYRYHSAEYEDCIIRQAQHKLKYDTEKENIEKKYYITYPLILEIPHDLLPDLMGPEDPRVVLRKTGLYEEPIIVFNMLGVYKWERRIYTFSPHRKVDPLVKLSLDTHGLRQNEKNWTPFFHPYYNSRSTISRGYIYFIYTFSPLEIFKCSLNSGRCSVTFDAKTLDLSGHNSFDGMRGGTQFVPLPSVLPSVKNKNIWVGFPKLHIIECGCATHFYRPMLDLLIESNGIYHQELVVPTIDFGIEVLSWDMKSTSCEGRNNILGPNSIAHWDILGQDPVTKKFDDYLVLTMSESDSVTKVVTLKGVLNYVLGIYAQKDIDDNFIPTKQSDYIVSRTMGCLMEEAKNFCWKYGELHKSLNNG